MIFSIRTQTPFLPGTVIEVDKLADFVVLSGDPTKVESMDLFNLTVEMTILDGEIVFGGI